MFQHRRLKIIATRKEIELIPISSKFVKTGGYLARIKNRYTLEYDEVLDEVVEESGLRLNRDNLRLILDSTFNTIIRNTLRDGNCRRVGCFAEDPLFRRPGKRDYRLRQHSPCLDAGDDSHYPDVTSVRDLLGNPRKIYDHVDLGCYEMKLPGMLLIVR